MTQIPEHWVLKPTQIIIQWWTEGTPPDFALREEIGDRAYVLMDDADPSR